MVGLFLAQAEARHQSTGLGSSSLRTMRITSSRLEVGDAQALEQVQAALDPGQVVLPGAA